MRVNPRSAIQRHRINHLFIGKHAISIEISDREGRVIKNHGFAVIPFLSKSGQGHRPRNHYQVTRYITQVVIARAEPVRSRLSHDLNLVSVGTHIARGSNIHSRDTAQSHRIDHFPVGKDVISVKICDREGRLIQNQRVSVNLILRQCGQGHRARIHYKITCHISQVVVTRAETVGSRLPRDRNRLAISTYIAPSITVQNYRVDHLAIRKRTIAVKIRHREGRLIQNHGVSVSSVLFRSRQRHRTLAHY